MDIPSDIISQIFDSNFVYGSVWYYRKFYFKSTNTCHDKYLIVLNPKAIDDRSYFICPTSRIDKINENKISIQDAFFIQKGRCDIFPVDTVIDVSNIQSRPLQEIRNRYVMSSFSKRIEYKGSLNASVMNSIRCQAISSKNISPKILKLVFP